MRKAKILVVDDIIKNVQLLMATLQDVGYELGYAHDGYEALKFLENSSYDLILLDVMMPGIDGFETCRRIKSNPKTSDIPVIFLTAKTEDSDMIEGFDVGGVDYVTKPFNKTILLRRVKTHIENKMLNDKEIEATQKEIIFTMGAIGETRSKETGNHVKRVAEYSKLLATLYGLDEEEAELIKMASPMHDIGKVGIPDNILNKPGKFELDEWNIMKTHAELGYEMLRHSQRPILKAAAIIANEHHEKIDGTGYPQGLKGEDIHIYGRITAVADVFDALGSDRVYKKAWELDRILELFKQDSGTHFDAKIVTLFLDNLELFLEIRKQFMDEI